MSGFSPLRLMERGQAALAIVNSIYPGRALAANGGTAQNAKANRLAFRMQKTAMRQDRLVINHHYSLSLSPIIPCIPFTYHPLHLSSPSFPYIHCHLNPNAPTSMSTNNIPAVKPNRKGVTSTARIAWPVESLCTRFTPLMTMNR
jgi:hypothetical protein